MHGCNKPKDKKSSCKGGAGEDVEEAEAEEGNDVLDVVQVSASDSLNILVRRSLGVDELVEGRIKCCFVFVCSQSADSHQWTHCEALLLLSHNVL